MTSHDHDTDRDHLVPRRGDDLRLLRQPDHPVPPEGRRRRRRRGQPGDGDGHRPLRPVAHRRRSTWPPPSTPRATSPGWISGRAMRTMAAIEQVAEARSDRDRAAARPPGIAPAARRRLGGAHPPDPGRPGPDDRGAGPAVAPLRAALPAGARDADPVLGGMAVPDRRLAWVAPTKRRHGHAHRGRDVGGLRLLGRDDARARLLPRRPGSARTAASCRSTSTRPRRS